VEANCLPFSFLADGESESFRNLKATYKLLGTTNMLVSLIFLYIHNDIVLTLCGEGQTCAPAATGIRHSVSEAGCTMAA